VPTLPVSLATNESHDNDWTEDEVAEVVKGFLPADSKSRCSATVNAGYKFNLTEYKSEIMKDLLSEEALEYSDETPFIGGIEALLWLSRGGNVTGFSIDLQIDDRITPVNGNLTFHDPQDSGGFVSRFS
jgi:hypothetical protein